jgi:hypothetical protein
MTRKEISQRRKVLYRCAVKDSPDFAAIAADLNIGPDAVRRTWQDEQEGRTQLLRDERVQALRQAEVQKAEKMERSRQEREKRREENQKAHARNSPGYFNDWYDNFERIYLDCEAKMLQFQQEFDAQRNKATRSVLDRFILNHYPGILDGMIAVIEMSRCALENGTIRKIKTIDDLLAHLKNAAPKHRYETPEETQWRFEKDLRETERETGAPPADVEFAKRYLLVIAFLDINPEDMPNFEDIDPEMWDKIAAFMQDDEREILTFDVEEVSVDNGGK